MLFLILRALLNISMVDMALSVKLILSLRIMSPDQLVGMSLKLTCLNFIHKAMAISRIREAIKIMVGIMEGLITGQGIMVALLGGLLGLQTFSLELLILAQREVLLGKTGMATVVPKLH